MKTILVIDDDETIRSVMRLYLEGEGHAVLEATDGKAGMRLFHAHPVDLVILDIFMPEKDGIETIQEIREAGNCRVLAISGGSPSMGMDFLHHAKAFGANDILVKPFSESELLGAVHRLTAD
ncbi:response regulator [Desulfovibrio sulfodismutans]|jgi:CheY-like chemotaxis protein|uniref:Response regulator n=1 Tax=Desulfolutivibrio sulfodismutans TaxID=63561 RepID=A0A7K3NGH5_9BACT|nr:response regulator [Desulfolutivibrio sulfodismutans]NDY55177.1 response regulator [Desulfolutivibrio sulfodismutans]QLA12145.1 response regulator [Desulfolutivibrio sulfodismutans DSM 3696]